MTATSFICGAVLAMLLTLACACAAYAGPIIRASSDGVVRGMGETVTATYTVGPEQKKNKGE